MESTSESLLDRVRERKDEAAWLRFVELYTPVIFGWARRSGFQEADACDLVQDVFTILVKKLGDFRYDPQQSFRAWLKTVLMNKIRERLRQNGAAQLPPDQEVAELVAANEFGDSDLRRDLMARALQIMRQDFQSTTWRACWGVVVEGKSAEDVARELGIRVGSVYAARFRVLARLRQELAGMLD